MTRTFLALWFGLAALAWMTQPARAQMQQCGERVAIVARLAKHYGETRQGVGLGQGNRLVELFASETTGTWTILVTLPSGMSCLVAAGEAWTGGAAAAEIAGDPA